jgi:hypothetical protein
MHRRLSAYRMFKSIARRCGSDCKLLSDTGGPTGVHLHLLSDLACHMYEYEGLFEPDSINSLVAWSSKTFQ